MSEKTTKKPGIVKYAISLKCAQNWAERWRSDPENTVKAHLIPMDDFTQIIKESDATNIRAYIGVDDKGVNKLMLVGVDEHGKDLINEKEGLLIYDFTLPCPSTCDIDSPLYTLK